MTRSNQPGVLSVVDVSLRLDNGKPPERVLDAISWIHHHHWNPDELKNIPNAVHVMAVGCCGFHIMKECVGERIRIFWQYWDTKRMSQNLEPPTSNDHDFPHYLMALNLGCPF